METESVHSNNINIQLSNVNQKGVEEETRTILHNLSKSADIVTPTNAMLKAGEPDQTATYSSFLREDGKNGRKATSNDKEAEPSGIVIPSVMDSTLIEFKPEQKSKGFAVTYVDGDPLLECERSQEGDPEAAMSDKMEMDHSFKQQNDYFPPVYSKEAQGRKRRSMARDGPQNAASGDSPKPGAVLPRTIKKLAVVQVQLEAEPAGEGTSNVGLKQLRARHSPGRAHQLYRGKKNTGGCASKRGSSRLSSTSTLPKGILSANRSLVFKPPNRCATQLAMQDVESNLGSESGKPHVFNSLSHFRAPPIEEKRELNVNAISLQMHSFLSVQKDKAAFVATEYSENRAAAALREADLDTNERIDE